MFYHNFIKYQVINGRPGIISAAIGADVFLVSTA